MPGARTAPSPQIVPDALLSQTLQNVEAPKAATSSRGVLVGIMNSPSSFGRYKASGAGGVGVPGFRGNFISRRAAPGPPLPQRSARRRQQGPKWHARWSARHPGLLCPSRSRHARHGSQHSCGRASSAFSRPPLPLSFSLSTAQFAVEQARYYDKAAKAATPEEATRLRVDKALVNVGALFLDNVSGRVSTEVDPRDHNNAGERMAWRWARPGLHAWDGHWWGPAWGFPTELAQRSSHPARRRCQSPPPQRDCMVAGD